MEHLRESVLLQLLPAKEYKVPDDEISFGGSVNLSIGGSEFDKERTLLPPMSPLNASSKSDQKSLVSQSCEYNHFDKELARSVKMYVGTRRVDVAPSPLLLETFAFDGKNRLGNAKAQIRRAMSSQMKRKPSRRAKRRSAERDDVKESGKLSPSGVKPIFTFDDINGVICTTDGLFDELGKISSESIVRIRKMYKDIIIEK